MNRVTGSILEQAEAEIRELNRKLLTLQYAGATVASTLNLQHILNTITREMLNLLEADGCIIYERNPASGAFTEVIRYGLTQSWRTEKKQPPVLEASQSSLVARVLSERSADQIMVDQPDGDPHTLACMKAAGVKTLLVMPLEFQDRIVGVLEVLNSRRPQPFLPKDIALAQLLANHGASAVTNVRLFQQLQQELAERKRAEETLREVADALATSEARLWSEMRSMLATTRALVSEININKLMEFIMSQARELTGAPETTVLLLTEDGKWLEKANPTESTLGLVRGARLAVKGSLAGLSLITHQVQTNSKNIDPRLVEPMKKFLQPATVYSLLCAPLIFQNKKLGVLLAWNIQEKEFAVNDELLMELLADQAALALHNADIYHQSRALAIEQERHRLARDLHDSVTQSLYSIGLAAQTLSRLLGSNIESKIKEPIELIYTYAQTALAEMREQLYHLHPTGLDQEDLAEVLRQHCQTLSKLYAPEIEFECNFEELLPATQRDVLYFITREALWNVVKHAQASRVIVKLTRQHQSINLTIKDNGVGFDPTLNSRIDTMGLRNMHERAKLSGGKLQIQAKPGYGTRLTAQIPLIQQDTEAAVKN